jgi:hypothetical protein
VDVSDEDAMPALAALLGITVSALETAIGGPWMQWQSGPNLDGPIVTFTGLPNPRTPERPLAAIRVDAQDQSLDVGYAVGVPLPNGRMQWALAEPRSTVPFGEDEDQHSVAVGLRDAVNLVMEAAVLKGTSW